MFKSKNNEKILDDKLLLIYIKLTKLFNIISILLILWIVIIIAGIYILEMNPFWAGLSLYNWVLFSIILIVVFLIIEIALYLYYISKKEDIVEFIDTESDYLHGKQIYNYTIPCGSKGGLFSKTYIKIDENDVLRLRNQMIPPKELWNK